MVSDKRIKRNSSAGEEHRRCRGVTRGGKETAVEFRGNSHYGRPWRGGGARSPPFSAKVRMLTVLRLGGGLSGNWGDALFCFAYFAGGVFSLEGLFAF